MSFYKNLASVVKLASMILVLGCGAQGCGGKRVAVDGNASPSVVEQDWRGHVAESLGITLVKGSQERRELPDPGQPYFSGDVFRAGTNHKIYLIQGSDWVVKPVVDLAERQTGGLPLYLAWHEEALPQKIVSAHYLYQKFDPLNRGVGDDERFSAGYDTLNRVWFVPVDRMLIKNNKYLDPSQSHWITLDLHFEDGTRTLVYICMRFMDGIPAPEFTEVESPHGHELFGVKPSEGWKVYSEKVSNPGFVPLKIIIDYQNDLALYTVLSRSAFQLSRESPPEPSGYIDSLSRAPFVIHSVKIQSSQGEVYAELIENRVQLVLHPREQVRLDWIATPTAPARQCVVPSPETHQHGWSVEISRRGEPSSQARFADYTTHYGIVGRTFQGVVSRKVTYGPIEWDFQEILSHTKSLRIVAGRDISGVSATFPDGPDLANCWF